MLRSRVIPALLLHDGALVKTRRFARPRYVGDPANTIRIFNELEVDELMLIDILATRRRTGPDLETLRTVADECFMPLGYGGGVTTFDQARAVFEIGVEKVMLNAAALDDPELITRIATHYGSQAVVVGIDFRRAGGRERVYRHVDRKVLKTPVLDWALEAQARGAGEILLTDVEREGTWSGYDAGFMGMIAAGLTIPVIAHGGARSIDDIAEVTVGRGCGAAAIGSMVVFQKKDMGVLVNFPDAAKLRHALTRRGLSKVA
jgi:cyclase